MPAMTGVKPKLAPFAAFGLALVKRTKDDRARFRAPTELNRRAAEDLGSACGIDKVTRLMPAVVVVPGQRDEAKGQSRQSKHMTAEVRTRN